MDFEEARQGIEQLAGLVEEVVPDLAALPPPESPGAKLLSEIEERERLHTESLIRTARTSANEVARAVDTLRRWMTERMIVRVIGAGRAKLAGAIPANRLAHGGARLYIVDDLVPMPHTYRAGGVIAVSASGKTPTVLEALRKARAASSGIVVVGIAMHDAKQFRELCDVFIGIRPSDKPNPLRALADLEEYVISRLLDAIVVAAGKAAGYDETAWRLGHENLGPTGPYDVAGEQKEDDERLAYDPSGGDTDRSRTLSEILKAIENRRALGSNALLLHGELGVGKRTFAWRALSVVRAEAENYGFSDTIQLSSYCRPWRETAKALALMCKVEASGDRANHNEAIQESLIAWFDEHPTLLVLDNVNQEDSLFASFRDRWTSVQASYLIMTSGDAPVTEEVSRRSSIPITGIGGYPAQKLVDASPHERNRKEYRKVLLDASSGNPQKLLYVSSREFTDRELERSLADLDGDGSDVVKRLRAIQRERLPIGPLIGLAMLRTTEFDIEILEYIWDGLDCGGAARYRRFLTLLNESNILTPTDGSRMRLNAHVQAEVRKAHEYGLFPVHTTEPQHFIAQYHRERFARAVSEQTFTTAALDDLESYTYHSVKYGKVEEAQEYVLAQLRPFFLAGLAGAAIPTLIHLQRSLGERKKHSEPIRVQRAEVEAELGHAFKDEGDYDVAIEHFNRALELLKVDDESGMSDRPDELLSLIYHYLGVAFSQTGRTRESWQAYSEGVRGALEGVWTELDALSLGYLAYEVKFHDSTLAQRIAQASVAIAKKLAADRTDKTVLVKNLCSFGQILSFAGRTKESNDVFADAFAVVAGNDEIGLRERGRLYVNAAVTAIAGEDWERARQLLGKADKALSGGGDPRRRAMAYAYRSIVDFRDEPANEAADDANARRSAAREKMATAMREHEACGAYREMIYELLALAWMEGRPTALGLVAGDSSYPPALRDAAKSLSTGGMDTSVFERFWEEQYAPALLDHSGG